MSDKKDFFLYLARQLHAWQDETSWLTADVVEEMCIQAAAETIGQDDPRAWVLRLRREINPEDLEIITVVEDVEDGNRLFLFSDDVRILRALLLSYDDSAPPRVGEPLSVPTRLEDGEVVSVVVEELLEEAELGTGPTAPHGAYYDDDTDESDLPGFPWGVVDPDDIYGGPK